MRATTKAMLAVWGVGCAAILAGCGGASRAPAQSPTAGYGGYAGDSSKSMAEERSASPPAGAQGQPGALATNEAPAPATTSLPAPEPSASAPTDRPGLGTEWGETRESRITEVSFLRADPDRPFAIAQLNYNDWSGVQAMASFHGGPRFHDFPAAGGAITVSIRGPGGEALDAMNVGGRTYVIGHEGERYSIVVENHTPRSFEAVATVDGLDVMNGQPGSYDNRGYVLGPWANLTIDGFRQSEDAVAAFRFSKVRDSYAASQGSARNVGVIGVAFFAQRGDDWNAAELRLRDTASPFPRDPRFAPPPR